MDKKGLICIGMIFLFISTVLSGCLQSTYQGRQPIYHLSLSSDGSKLLSVSGGLSCNSPAGKGYGLHVWNTTSGELIWSECPSKFADISIDASIFYDIYLSPRGEYFVKYPSMIYNSSTGELVGELHGYYKAWSADDKIIATQIHNGDDIILYNTSDFTSFKTVKIGEMASFLTLSPNGTKLAFMPRITRKGPYPISVIDASAENAENITLIWSITNEDIERLIWSSDIIKLVHFRPPRPHIKKMWNASTGEIINITDQNVFNWPYLKAISDIDEKFRVFDLSYDEKIMALGYFEGIIEIRNATTGVLISTLKTPLYEMRYVTPFPSISYLLFGIIVLIFLIRRKNRRV